MNLKTIALATTALVAIAAGPANAGQYMGKVNLGLGYVWEDYDFNGGPGGNEFRYTALHGSGSVNVPYNDRVNLQFDVFGAESLDGTDGGFSEDSYYGGFGAGAHINYRDPTAGALGVFVAVGRANPFNTDSNAVVFAGGLEGEYYCSAWTIGAQVGYLDSDNDKFGLVKSAGFVRASAAYYASSKLKLNASVGYLNGDTTNSGPAEDFDEWNWTLGVEYLFGKSIPVSTYVEYRGLTADVFDSPSDEIDRHEVRGGVRFYFGGGDDLMKADREGAGMESPDILTWPRFDSD
jgi:hypothetical protein